MSGRQYIHASRAADRRSVGAASPCVGRPLLAAAARDAQEFPSVHEIASTLNQSKLMWWSASHGDRRLRRSCSRGSDEYYHLELRPRPWSANTGCFSEMAPTDSFRKRSPVVADRGPTDSISPEMRTFLALPVSATSPGRGSEGNPDRPQAAPRRQIRRAYAPGRSSRARTQWSAGRPLGNARPRWRTKRRSCDWSG